MGVYTGVGTDSTILLLNGLMVVVVIIFIAGDVSRISKSTGGLFLCRFPIFKLHLLPFPPCCSPLRISIAFGILLYPESGVSFPFGVNADQRMNALYAVATRHKFIQPGLLPSPRNSDGYSTLG